MENEIVLDLPVRLRGRSLHLNIHKYKKILRVEHGDTVSIKLSDVTVVKHPVNTEFDKILEQRKKDEIKQIKHYRKIVRESKKKDRYEVL